MFPLQAGVPDSLPDLLPAHAKAAARLWELQVAAQEVQAAPLLVLAWVCLSFPSLKKKITLRIRHMRW